jgi:hypothetical protein
MMLFARQRPGHGNAHSHKAQIVPGVSRLLNQAWVHGFAKDVTFSDELPEPTKV